MKKTIIKRSSWHFRIVNFWTSNKPPKDICSYVRQLVFALFIWAVLVLIAVLVTVVLLTGIYSIVAMILFNAEYARDSIFTVSANITTVVTVFATALTGHHYITKWFRNRKDKPKSIEDGLIKTYFKDRKSKMCSMVDFED